MASVSAAALATGWFDRASRAAGSARRSYQIATHAGNHAHSGTDRWHARVPRP